MPARAALLLACLAALAACSKPDDARPVDSAAAASPNVASFSATEYAITAPDSIPAGWSTIRLANRGQEVHYGHIVRLDSGRTIPDLVNGYLEAIRTSGPRPAWVKRFGGPGGTAPGDSSSVTQHLEPGRYVWICPVEDSSGTPHFSRGEVTPLVVYAVGAAPAGAAREPAATAGLRLVDHDFAVDSALTAGRHTIRVENAGAEAHDLVMMKLAPGRTIEDIRKWLNPERARRDDEAEAPPPIESLGTLAGGVAAIAPGMHVYFDAALAPGEYALFCMVTARDGRSHIEHGMLRQLRVE